MLLENAKKMFITKCNNFFKLQNATVLLQNALVITECNDFIMKCDVYYKICQ